MKKIAAIFIFALIVRFGMVYVWHQSGQGNKLSNDATVYYEIGKNVSQGKGFHYLNMPTSRRPPVYPIFVAALLLAHFPFPLGIQIAQAFLGAASCIVLFMLAKKIFNEKTAILASGIFSIDYLSVRETVSIMPEVLFLLFLLTSFYFLILAQKNDSTKWFAIAGLLAGLATLTKDVTVFFFPAAALLGVFYFAQTGKMRFARSFLFLAAFFLTIAPWVIRNSLLNRHPVLITVSSGHTFYIGNGPQTVGNTTGGEWLLGRDTDYPKDPNFPVVFTVEADRLLWKRALDYIQRHPERFVELMKIKIINMWRPAQTDSSKLIQWITTAFYLPVLTFGLIGFALTKSRWKEFFSIPLFLFYMFSIHAITISSIRYRYPVMPFLMLFGSFAWITFWNKIKMTKRQEVASYA